MGMTIREAYAAYRAWQQADASRVGVSFENYLKTVGYD